ncbi:MAG: hypothetical protein AAGA48_04185 [Myxococcota bacterium]
MVYRANQNANDVFELYSSAVDGTDNRRHKAPLPADLSVDDFIIR